MESVSILMAVFFSFGLAALSTPWFIRKMEFKGQVVRDYYKPGNKMIPTNAGILTLYLVFITIIILPLVFRLFYKVDPGFPREFSALDNAILMTILLYAFYGVLDDYIDVGRFSKIIIPLMFSYPLVIVLDGWNPWIPGLGVIELSSLDISLGGLGILTGAMMLKYAIVPIYIMVVANLKNMHAGFNGLQSGCALIVLSFLLLKSSIDNNLSNMYTIAAIVGAQAVFFWHNKYPSKIIEGNIGSLAVGSAIGAALVVQHYLLAGMVMLLPHIINFIMYFYWRMMHRKYPDDPKWKITKWGSVREDGTLEVPNRLTLKWVLPYHFPMTEKQATYAMYLLTTVFCVIGLFIPG